MTTASELADELETLDTALPAGPWTLWTSCSYRRIGGPTGADGDVLHAYLQRSDNHPDLSMPEEQLRALVALRNRLPTILSALRRVDGMERVPVADLIADLERRAASCCELKAKATTTHDAHRLMGKEAAYLHAAELARQALTGEAQ